MAGHDFNFKGGNFLSRMGATWFVSYSYYCNINKSHKNWKNVSTCPSRISVFNKTGNYHKFWLEQIICMNDRRLNTNTIGLDTTKTKEMAKILLQKY
jgi:hypothetical protein